MADIHRRGLIRSHSGILQSAKYSDLTVRCGSEEFKIHRAIVCPRSKFFAAACDGQFREAQTSLIVLQEDDPSTVYRMLTYLYTLDYDDDGSPPASAEHYMANGTKVATFQALTSAEDLLRHVKMMNNVVVYAIAQKYDINELKELATKKFSDLLWLKAPNYAFPNIIDAVFETSSITDPGLRVVAARYCVRYSTEILADDHLCGVIKDHGELGLDVLREVSLESARNLDQKRRLREQLVTLKEDIRQTIKQSLRPSQPVHTTLLAALRELKTTYNNLEIESDESAGTEEGNEGDKGDEGDENKGYE